MPNGWSAKNVTLSNKVVSGVVTDEPITVEFANSAGGALNGIIKLAFNLPEEAAGTITTKLQTANSNDWVDVKTGPTVTGLGGIYYLRWSIQVAADQPTLPLLNKSRIVISSTDAADVINVDLIEVLEEL